MKKLFSLLTLALLTSTAWAADYVKVTADANLASGTYLIVYEDGGLAFNGGLETLDATQNTIAVTITDGKIASSDAVNAAAFTIDVTAGTIKSASGYYIGRTGDTNGMNFATTEPTELTNSISIAEDGSATIQAKGGAYLRYNATSGQERFRYFKSSTYTNQKPVALYYLEGSAPAVSVAAPTLPEAQNFDDTFTVTITNNENGASLHYSNDGLAWQDYTQPIVITETTTIYAKATKNGVDSRIVSATYTKNAAVTGNVFTLVTDAATLAAGDQIILVNQEAAMAMGGSRGNNFGAVAVSISGNNVTASDVNVITLVANGNNWNLKTAGGYLYAASSTGNQMKLENEVDTDGNANAAISIQGDSAIIVFQGTSTRNVVRFNHKNNPVLFSCYSETNTLKPVYIYKATNEIPIVEIADPVFDPGTCGFTGSQIVKITCATEGAQIYYSINEGEFMPYQNAITVTEDSTVLKAYAEIDGHKSNTVTAKYYKRAEVNTIQQANELENKKDFVFYGSAVVVYQNDKNLWIKDNTGYGLIYGDQVPVLEVGSTLEAEWVAQHYLFRDMIHEYQYPSNVTATDDELVTIEPIERTALTTDNINERVIMKGLTLLADANDAMYLYNAADSMAIYNQFGIEYPTIEEGKTYNVEGMVSYYKHKVQIMPIAITEASAEPEFELGDVNHDGLIDVSDVTALITYVLNEGPGIYLDTANVDGVEGIDVADVTALITYVLQN
jgi:hypothetical protein